MLRNGELLHAYNRINAFLQVLELSQFLRFRKELVSVGVRFTQGLMHEYIYMCVCVILCRCCTCYIYIICSHYELLHGARSIFLIPLEYLLLLLFLFLFLFIQTKTEFSSRVEGSTSTTINLHSLPAVLVSGDVACKRLVFEKNKQTSSQSLKRTLT